MADSDSILQLGVEAARAGDKAEARELFRLVTREDPNNVQGWLWLAGVAEDREEKRAALEQVVALDPDNQLARKGLAALEGRRPARPVSTAPAAPASAETPQVVAPLPVPVEEAPRLEPEPAPVVAETPPRRRPRARTYDAPAAPVAAGVAAGAPDRVTVDADDEYDLDDYRRPATAGARTGDRRAVVVDDDEPERRRGFAWLPALLGLALLGLLLFFIWDTLANRPQVAGTEGNGAGAGVAATDGALGLGTVTIPAGGLGGDATAVASLDVTAVGEGTTNAEGSGLEATPAPADAGAATSAPIDATAVTPAPDVGLTAGPPESTAPPADAATPPPADAGAQPGQTTVVVVPPAATVAPPPQPTTAPTQPAATPPPAGDVSAANPAIVANGTAVDAGSWRYTYGGISNVASGSYGGGPPSRGQYQIVLLSVGNNGAQPSTIPDGFFVMKDAQGRVYDFNRAASVDYLNRFGGPGVAADIGADTPLQPNGLLTSVPLLFDVPRDATNLVLFSRENLNQGFVIR